MTEAQEMIANILNRYNPVIFYVLMLIVICLTIAMFLKKIKAWCAILISGISLYGIFIETFSTSSFDEWAGWYLYDHEAYISIIERNNRIWNITFLISGLLLLIQLLYTIVCFVKKNK